MFNWQFKDLLLCIRIYETKIPVILCGENKHSIFKYKITFAIKKISFACICDLCWISTDQQLINSDICDNLSQLLF